MMTRFFLRPAALACLVVSLPAFAADLAPDAMVKKVAGDTLAAIKADKAMQRGDINRIIALVDRTVMPNVNFTRMTGTAVGPAWRTATPAQKVQLEKEFKTLLVRTYSNALTQYRNQQIDFKPLKAKPEDTDVVVRTEVRQAGAKPVQIDYSLDKQGDNWKVYDVMVAGVSLVTNYRDSFGQEVRAGGIDGLIKSLKDKNKQLETTVSAKK